MKTFFCAVRSRLHRFYIHFIRISGFLLIVRNTVSFDIVAYCFSFRFVCFVFFALYSYGLKLFELFEWVSLSVGQKPLPLHSIQYMHILVLVSGWLVLYGEMPDTKCRIFAAECYHMATDDTKHSWLFFATYIYIYYKMMHQHKKSWPSVTTSPPSPLSLFVIFRSNWWELFVLFFFLFWNQKCSV